MSKFNSEPIDIIIPWVNPNDPVWKKDFEYWKQKETGNKDKCRYRDWGSIKYVLRSIEKNCPWCRYVFLVLSSPSQIPTWLNIKNPKLKIIYHNDYIPAEFLPTFNSNVIEMFFYKIEELSENFISCNDDMFFTQPLKENFFFIKDIPVCRKKVKPIFTGEWDNMLKCCIKLADKILNNNTNIMYDSFHLPVAYNKTFQAFIMEKIKTEFNKAFSKSKFRHENNLTHLLFFDLQCKTNHCIIMDNKRGDYYRMDFINTRPIDFNNKTICINENKSVKNIHIIKTIKSLNEHFKVKSSFEK